MIHHSLNDDGLFKLLKRRGFQVEYFWLPELSPQELALRHPDCTECEWQVFDEEHDAPDIIDERSITVPLIHDYRLTLELTSELHYLELYLSSPAHSQPLLLGYDDESAGCPWVFRWTELDALYRFLSLTYFQKIAEQFLLLMYRFCPITTMDEWKQLEPILLSTWSHTQLFSAMEMKCLMAIALQGTTGLSWRQQHPYGWVLEGQNAFSLRQALL